MHAKPEPMSPEQYLEREGKNPLKHEYVDGELHAMAGATRRHNLIVSNLLYHARHAARAGNRCQVFGSDMKVRVPSRNSFYYPDLSTCCDPTDREELFLAHPCFIVEVASPSTAGIDRREKRVSYATLQSLEEYAVVDQDRLRVEVHQREDGRWRSYLLNAPDDVLESSCLKLALTLEDIYEGVSLPPEVTEPAYLSWED